MSDDKPYRPGMVFTRQIIASGLSAQNIMKDRLGLNKERVKYLLNVIKDGEKAQRDLAKVYGEEYVQAWLKTLKAFKDGKHKRRARQLALDDQGSDVLPG